MSKRAKRDRPSSPDEIGGRDEAGLAGGEETAAGTTEEYQVSDRRHWADTSRVDEDAEPSTPKQPTLLDEYRSRAEAAERQLQEYIEAFKRFKADHEEFRDRLSRDVDRKVDLKFGELIGELLESVDDLELALEHASQVPQAEPLARGVELARRRFLATLERHGVTQFSLDGEEFDPNEAEAVRIDPVGSADQNETVTETVRPGYRLGDRVIRAARVAVGRHGGR